MRISDWSSDVCSSDLAPHGRLVQGHGRRQRHDTALADSRAQRLFRHGSSPRHNLPHPADKRGEQPRTLHADPGQPGTGITAIETGCHCTRSEEHTSELQSLMRISYAVFCLKKKIKLK